MHQLDPNLLHRSILKLTTAFPKCFTGLYMSLCTGYISLNKHLHHIGKADSS
ncbi:hypothetical protein BDR06DRAFT_874303 [Suillus hirtellus]|nr:hypothetical protein BDR06DRAFT_874303 [Suillus hirtellus]